MKPYFQTEHITIYNGDCLAILPSLPEGSVDLLLTDPPYSVSYESGQRNTLGSFDAIAGDDSPEAALAGVRAALRCLRNGRHVYVFGRYEFAGLALSEPAELIWDKGQVSGGDLSKPWGPQHEYIQFATHVKSKANRAEGYGRLSARLRRGSVLRYDRLSSLAVTSHPTEKPVALLRELIESSSVFGEVVLDPFMGVGSVLVAAQLEGRRAIGIEIDERYCHVAANRLAQQPLPLGEVMRGTYDMPGTTVKAGQTEMPTTHNEV